MDMLLHLGNVGAPPHTGDRASVKKLTGGDDPIFDFFDSGEEIGHHCGDRKVVSTVSNGTVEIGFLYFSSRIK
jgi:hypothetical protein